MIYEAYLSIIINHISRREQIRSDAFSKLVEIKEYLYIQKKSIRSRSWSENLWTWSAGYASRYYTSTRKTGPLVEKALSLLSSDKGEHSTSYTLTRWKTGEHHLITGITWGNSGYAKDIGNLREKKPLSCMYVRMRQWRNKLAPSQPGAISPLPYPYSSPTPQFSPTPPSSLILHSYYLSIYSFISFHKLLPFYNFLYNDFDGGK